MLTPQQIVDIVETMYPTIDELNQWIQTDIIKRLMARLERDPELFLTATDEWQLDVFQQAGGHLESVQQEIIRWTKKSDAEIKRIFEDAGIKSLAYDSDFYVNHGLEGFNLGQSESMIRLLEDTYQRTIGTVHNFTRTTANASQQKLIKTLDAAHFKVASGATSYTEAVREAVLDLANTQATVVYPSGHIDTIETAVLRAVRTGVAQASGNMAVQGMIERDWDVILVSAHLGARYGDGGNNPSNHFWWQGKFYSRTGRTPNLPLFTECTGYGTREGLCGWNCRHSFGPGDLRHNPYTDFDAEENKKAYDLSQKQRAAERKIRHQKTKLVGLHTAMDNATSAEDKANIESVYQKEALKLKKYNDEYSQLCEDNNLKKLSDRIAIQKWNRSEALKSISSADFQKKLNDATYELTSLREKGIIRAKGNFIKVPPVPQKFDFSNDHAIMRMNERNLSKSDIISFASEAKCALSQRNGSVTVFYSERGFVAIQNDSKQVQTVGELDKGGKILLRVAKEHGLFK